MSDEERLAVQDLLDMTGWTAKDAIHELEDSDFLFHHETAGGYVQYDHPDGSRVWIRPNGEIVRLGPEVKGQKGKKYRRRYDQHGDQTRKHSTGETLDL